VIIRLEVTEMKHVAVHFDLLLRSPLRMTGKNDRNPQSK